MLRPYMATMSTNINFLGEVSINTVDVLIIGMAAFLHAHEDFDRGLCGVALPLVGMSTVGTASAAETEGLRAAAPTFQLPFPYKET